MENKKPMKRLSQADILYKYYQSMEPKKRPRTLKKTARQITNDHKRIQKQGEILKAILSYQAKKLLK